MALDGMRFPYDIKKRWDSFLTLPLSDKTRRLFDEWHAFSLLYLVGATLHESSAADTLWERYTHKLNTCIVKPVITDAQLDRLYPITSIDPMFDMVSRIDLLDGTTVLKGRKTVFVNRIPCKEVHCTMEMLQRPGFQLASGNSVLVDRDTARLICCETVTRHLIHVVKGDVADSTRRLLEKIKAWKSVPPNLRNDDMCDLTRYAKLVWDGTLSLRDSPVASVADIEDLAYPVCMRDKVGNLSSDNPTHMTYNDRNEMFSFMRRMGVDDKHITDKIMRIYKATTKKPEKNKMDEIKKKYKTTYEYKKTCAKCSYHSTPLACARSQGVKLQPTDAPGGVFSPAIMTRLLTDAYKNGAMNIARALDINFIE